VAQEEEEEAEDTSTPTFPHTPLHPDEKQRLKEVRGLAQDRAAHTGSFHNTGCPTYKHPFLVLVSHPKTGRA